MYQPGPRNLITDVDDISVGNAQDERVRSGVTVVLPKGRILAACDVRGGAPGTRETDALDPSALSDEIDGIVLSGGSVYGLDAASGAVAWLGARGRGIQIPGAPCVAPVVPQAILFDLSNGGDKAWGMTPPYRDLAVAACEGAQRDFALGNSGAGFGARAGELKGGLGSASLVGDDGLRIGALIAVNSFGSAVVPGTKHFWSAPFEIGDEFGGAGPAPSRLAQMHPLAGSKAAAPGAGVQGNTTIGVVALNAVITRAEARRIAIMAQDGLARAIRPVHAPVDGDVIFVISTCTRALGQGLRPLHLTTLGALGADCVARAVARAVYAATGLGDAPAYRDRFPG